MKLPFVSRAVHERVLEELRKSESERKELFKLLGAAKEPTEDPVQVLLAHLTAIASGKPSPAEDAEHSNPGSLTIPRLRDMAQTWANNKPHRAS